MKFKALTVRNFQRHKKKTLEFSKTITTLVGSTDAGKSSLLRALRWVCLNDFVGNDFIREGSSKAQVQVVLRHEMQNLELTRTKGERVNTYDLNGREFKSFATNVPEDITRVLQLNEINFQGQHDAPFWFNETAGEVSRRLNAVVDLSVIDIVLSKSAAVLRESESLVQVCGQRLAGMDQDQAKLNPQLERITHYADLWKKKESYEQKNKYTDQLESILQEGSDYSEKIRDLRTRIASADDLRKRLSVWLQRDREHSTLGRLLSDVAQLQKVSQPPGFNAIILRYDSARSAQRQNESLEALVGTIAKVEQTIKTATARSLEAAQVFHRATKGERCPLCLNPI